MALDAILFDVDGTLVDSNPLHVEAWRRVFAANGYPIPSDRIFTEIGKGGDNLVPAILGEQVDGTLGDELREQQPREFAKLAEAQSVRPFQRVAELLEQVRGRGLKVVLATSGESKTLKVIEKASGIPFSKLVDHVTTASDIDRSKPAPDLISAAVAALGLSPAQCAMVGDTPYDAQASRLGGVACIGVRSGGHNDATLLGAGARLVYADAAELLVHLDDAIHQCSPGSIHLTHKKTEILMREALQTARDGLAAGQAPIGCVLARGDGTILARGYNEQQASQDKSAHAEIVTFRRAAGLSPLGSKDLILVCTLEPCVMCTGAAMIAGVDTVLFGLPAPNDGGLDRVTPPTGPQNQMPRFIGNILPEDSRALLEHWLAKNPDPEQAAYVRQLLAAHGK